MTGFKSKRAAALDEDGMYLVHHTAQEPTLQEQLAIAQSDWDKANSDWGQANLVNGRYILAQPVQERNFCERCGKRTRDLTTIHTCTSPQEKNNG